VLQQDRDMATAPDLTRLVATAVDGGDDRALVAALCAASALPGPRLALGVVAAAADALAGLAVASDEAGTRVASIVDRWASLSLEEAPGDHPAVILPCIAMAVYGRVAATRSDWWPDELAKLHDGAGDARWRVRELVAQGLQRMLVADWSRTVEALQRWATEHDPLVVRAAVAAVAEPSLLLNQQHAADALDVQRIAVATFGRLPSSVRRDPDVRTLRQALGFTVSVAVAAAADVAILHELATSTDADLRWIARQNLAKARLSRWPDEVARAKAALER
jgi:hypothetical protein